MVNVVAEKRQRPTQTDTDRQSRNSHVQSGWSYVTRGEYVFNKLKGS